MTKERMIEIFNQLADEPIFPKVSEQLSHRRDLNGMMILANLFPEPTQLDFICCAEHDQIWFDVDINQLAERATEQQILDIMRCGIWFDSNIESLTMFV